MPTFNSLPEAQSFARANGLSKYFRVHFTDETTRAMRGRGGWWPELRPAFRFYMDLTEAIDCVTKHANSADAGRCEIEAIYTANTSDSPKAR